MPFLTLQFIALGLLLATVSGVWLISLKARDASLIDLFWAALFALQAAFHLVLADPSGLRAVAVVILVTLWAIRLGAHLARRNLGKGEDRRYAEMRAAGGAGWALRSLVTVFWLQALLAWVIGWPVALTASAAGTPGVIGAIGLGVATLGLLIEALADHQLARFKADAKNRGRVMDRGLWRYSRHPNYFGDAVLWWGLWIVSLEVAGPWTVFAPLLMTVLLLRVSGVPLLEGHLARTRPGYEEYVRRTSAFVPWPPKAPRSPNAPTLPESPGSTGIRSSHRVDP